MLENSPELQDYSNYIILQNIYSSYLKDEDMAALCLKRANATLTMDYKVPTRENYSSPIEEWSVAYTSRLYQSTDLKLAKEAETFLENHRSLWSYNNFSLIASFYDRMGDFKRARQLFERALKLVHEKPDEAATLFTYANFLFKSGDYQKVEELILLNEELMDKAPEFNRLTYEVGKQTISMFYSLYTGDYPGYVKASDQYFDYLTALQPQDLGYDAYALSRLSNRALGEEYIGEWDAALKSWESADSAWIVANNKTRETYPNFPVFYYSLSSFFKAKLGRLENSERAIAELDAYYEATTKLAPIQHAVKVARAEQYGFYKDDRYHDAYKEVIGEMKKTRDFTEATRPMALMAYFLMRDQALDQSFQAYKNLFDANLEWINDIIFTFGEKAFVAYYTTKLKEGYDNYHSFVKLMNDQNHALYAKVVAQVYENTLLTKSIAFKGVRKRKKAFLLSNTEEVTQLYYDWIARKQELIQYYQILQSQEQKNNHGSAFAGAMNRDSLAQIQLEVDQMENRLATEAKGFQSTLKIEASDWKTVRRRLKPGEAAVEMVRFQWRDQVFYSDSAYYAAYLIKSDSKHPEVVYFPSQAKELEGKFYNYYKNAIRLKYEDQSSYDQFWKPLKKSLSGIDKVYFSGDGIFHMISLPTLRNPETGKFLIDEINVQQVTSTADIKDQRPLNIRTSALFGRPNYRRGNLPTNDPPVKHRSFVKQFRNTEVTDLPGTEQETVAIDQTLKKADVSTTLFLGDEATEGAIYQVNSPDILHIATHGFWSENAGSTGSDINFFQALVNSGLLLSGVVDYYQSDEPVFTHDGILTAYEAQNLDLENTELVVLSACETGLGSMNAGEGVYGLQRAFRAAGADYLITSLWKVDDGGTKDFMIAFYTALLETSNVRKAFLTAQQQIKDKYRDPYYWGAFVLMGD